MEGTKRDDTCAVHTAMVTIIHGFSRRIRRIELIGLSVVAMTAGLFGKDFLLPLILKMMGS